MQNCSDNREAAKLKVCNICHTPKEKKHFYSKGRGCRACIAEKERMKSKLFGANWIKMFIG